MSVYNDMASDAGYSYGSNENKQMAQMIEQEWEEYWAEQEEREEYERQEWERYYADQKELETYREILFRRF